MRKNRTPGDDDEEVDLSPLDRDFAAAAPATTSVPDGRYPVRVEHVELITSRTSRRPFLKWTLLLLAPDHRNRRLWKKSILASPAGLRWLKHDLGLCGLDLQKLSDLPGHLAELVGIELDVTKRTRNDWENVHFNRRIQPADHDGPAAF